MTKSNLSRRDFLKGAGVTGMAGALALGGASAAFADEPAAAGEAAPENPYSGVLGEDASLLPMRKADCPGPHGPVAFEGRTIADDEVVATEDTEVLIIGAGIGGIMASLKAAEEGAQVLMIEKMTEGHSAWESFGATQATFQKEQGIEIDDAQLIDEILRASDWRADPEVITSYVKHSGEVADFWQAMFDKTGTGWQIYKFDQAPNFNGFPVIDSYVNFKMPEGISKTWLFGLHVCEDLLKAGSMYPNWEVRYSTPAVQLVKGGGDRVTGAIAKTAEGYTRINASKGVLLATGGYDANPEMMQAWVRPEDYQYSSWWNPSWGTTGDGHMMGLAVGAEMDSLPQPVMNFSNATPSTFVEKRVYFPGAMNWGIMVTEEGKRFTNENNPRQYAGNAMNLQIRRGHTCFCIFDEAMIASALEKGGEAAAAQLDRDEAKGHLFRAGSIAEVASKAGIDGAALEATINEYNQLFADNVERDPEYYRYTGNNQPFTGGTYYALLTCNVILATVGGLAINGNAQVLDTAGAPIEGLYATGNASGSFYAGNYPRHIPGTSVGRAATFGYVAADHMVNGGSNA
ncbi:FAD-dependent oxidoreductase [Adlercreutzia mucosicola]|uniref:FAD-dependent oxidoreductase n=1 Tax=Adlercreutzia mucosicola TaxID=580026 RepID=UPI002B25123B|nr:FAD-binding protein [Adlercreutzia mucosicola]MEB1813269.1 FAD-binding protein [Adlercreutzia mucosicola]